MEIISPIKNEKTVDLLLGDSKVRPHEAVVATETLICLNILNQTWLYATRQLESEPHQRYTEGQNSHPKMMLCFIEAGYDIFCEKHVAMVSLEAAFNILFPDIDAFNKFKERNKIRVCLHSTGNVFYGPPVADKVTISAIRSPLLSSISESYDRSLKAHFMQKRYLVLNQVFCVPYRHEGKVHNSNANVAHLWFKVTHIQDKTGVVDVAWVSAEYTMMSEVGSRNSFIPCKEVYSASCRLIGGLQDEFEIAVGYCLPVAKNISDYSAVSLLLHGPAASGKRCLAMMISNFLCLHFYEINCFDLVGESLAAVEQRVKSMFEKARYCSPCLFLLKNIHAFCRGQGDNGDEPRLIRYLSECLEGFSSKDKVLAVATTNCFNQISSSVTRLFTYQIEIAPPCEEVRLKLMRVLLEGEEQGDCNLEVISKQTAGMVVGDLHSLISEALKNAHMRACDSEKSEKKPTVYQQDIENALEKIHSEYKEMLGMPDIPQVSWTDVGGLANVKAEIIDTIKLPMQCPELISKGLQRSGLLLYGPPGCGKTLLAKAVATEFALNFFSVKGPELMNMYVGQSEQNIRDMFQKARESSPCIVFFDELDSIAPNRGRSGDSGGVMDRIVSQLLAELDGLQTSNDLFVIGATNRPDLLDSALLRPGRFDKMVYVGFPETKADRLNIIKSYTNKMRLLEDVDLDKLENSLPLYLTGADFYALCSDAYLNGIKRCIRDNASDDSEGEVNSQKGILITVCDFDIAAKELTPSVSIDDVLKYKEIKSRIDNERTKRK